MDINSLVEKYLSEIEIEDADYVPFDDAKHDAACLLLNIPVAMLREYLNLKGQEKNLPDEVEFWKETGLCRRLKSSDRHAGQAYATHLPAMESFSNFLSYLEGKVQVGYEMLNNLEKIRLRVTEIPAEFFKD